LGVETEDLVGSDRKAEEVIGKVLPAEVAKHRFTVEEFRKMGEAGIFGEDDRVELVDGEIVEMAPIGWRHMESANALTGVLADLRGGSYGAIRRYARGEEVRSATLVEVAFEADEVLPG
jgi:hypothetical protein